MRLYVQRVLCWNMTTVLASVANEMSAAPGFGTLDRVSLCEVCLHSSSTCARYALSVEVEKK